MSQGDVEQDGQGGEDFSEGRMTVAGRELMKSRTLGQGINPSIHLFTQANHTVQFPTILTIHVQKATKCPS